MQCFIHFSKSKGSIGSLRFSFFSLSRSWQQWQAGEWDSAPTSFFLLPASLTSYPKCLSPTSFPFRECNFQMGFRTDKGKKENVLLEAVFHFKVFFSDNFSSGNKRLPEVKGCYSTFESINFCSEWI